MILYDVFIVASAIPVAFAISGENQIIDQGLCLNKN